MVPCALVGHVELVYVCMHVMSMCVQCMCVTCECVCVCACVCMCVCMCVCACACSELKFASVLCSSCICCHQAARKTLFSATLCEAIASALCCHEFCRSKPHTSIWCTPSHSARNQQRLHVRALHYTVYLLNNPSPH